MQYWRLPERLYDEPDEFRQWALNAFAVAERAKKAKPAPKRKAGKSKKKDQWLIGASARSETHKRDSQFL